jgi:hypothetical protein
MKMPPEILTRLLKGEHFNVEQRNALGLWPCETLAYNEVAAHLARLLESDEWFPQTPPTPIQDAAIREGIYIQRQERNLFLCFAQRSRTNAPSVLAEKTQTEFHSARSAANFYLKWELNLPGRLDGWPVV